MSYKTKFLGYAFFALRKCRASAVFEAMPTTMKLSSSDQR